MGILGAVVLPNSPLPNLRPSGVLLPSPFFLQPNLHQPCVYYGVCWQLRQNCVQDVLPTQTCAIDSIAGGRAHPKPEIWNTAQAASKPVVSPKLRLSQTSSCTLFIRAIQPASVQNCVHAVLTCQTCVIAPHTPDICDTRTGKTVHKLRPSPNCVSTC